MRAESLTSWVELWGRMLRMLDVGVRLVCVSHAFRTLYTYREERTAGASEDVGLGKGGKAAAVWVKRGGESRWRRGWL
jgi:hypothetical protein